MRSTGAHEVQRGWTVHDHSAEAPFLTFVQLARGCAFSGSTLELLDLAPVTVCVGPAPRASLGHVTTSAFLDLWWAADDPPLRESQRDGVVSLVDPERSPWFDTRVRLSRPRIHGSGLRYDVEIVDGTLPASSGSCAVFIDPAAAASRTEAPS